MKPTVCVAISVKSGVRYLAASKPPMSRRAEQRATIVPGQPMAACEAPLAPLADALEAAPAAAPEVSVNLIPAPLERLAQSPGCAFAAPWRSPLIGRVGGKRRAGAPVRLSHAPGSGAGSGALAARPRGLTADAAAVSNAPRRSRAYSSVGERPRRMFAYTRSPSTSNHANPREPKLRARSRSITSPTRITSSSRNSSRASISDFSW